MSAVEALMRGRMADGNCSLCGRTRKQHGALSCKDIDEIEARAARAQQPLWKRVGKGKR